MLIMLILRAVVLVLLGQAQQVQLLSRADD